MIDNICLRCDKEFTTKTKPSKYCSQRCRQKFKNIKKEEHTSTCLVCSKEYRTSTSRKKYCSLSCRYERQRLVYQSKHPSVYRTSKIKKEFLHKKCLKCETEFNTWRENRLFCSVKCERGDEKQICGQCKREFQSTRIKKYCSPKCRNRYHNKFIPTNKSCPICSKEFISMWKKKYCSRECSSKHFNAIRIPKLKNSDCGDLIEFYELIASQKIGKEQFIIEVIVDKRRYRLLWTQCFGDDKGLNLMSIVDKYFNYSPLPPLKWVTHFFTRVKRRYDHIKFGTPLKHEKIKREHE